MDEETLRRELFGTDKDRKERATHVRHHGDDTERQEIHRAHARRNQSGARPPEAGHPRARLDQPVRHPQIPGLGRPHPLLDVSEVRLPAAVQLGVSTHHQVASAPRHQPCHHRPGPSQPDAPPGRTF